MPDILGPGLAGAVNPATSRPAGALPNTAGAAQTWFKDCSSPTLDDGTEVNARWANAVLAQLRTVFAGMGISQDNADDMLLRAIQASTNGLDSRYVLKAGDTMTGDLYRTGAAGTQRQRGFQTATLQRFTDGVTATAETGANAGSDWFLNRFNDAGGYLGTPIQVRRADGLVTFERRPVWPGAAVWDNLNLRRLRASYTAPGNTTFTVPADVTRIFFQMCGGGGGGAGMLDGPPRPGGGGGAGGYVAGYATVTPGQVLSITVGAGGTGGAIGTSGGNGATSLIAGIASVGGGAGGGNLAGSPAGGDGGGTLSAVGEVLTIPGGMGTDGDPSGSGFAGDGGASFFGGGGRSAGNLGGGGNAGFAGRAPGSGGGSAYGVVASPGGAGAAGIVVIDY